MKGNVCLALFENWLMTRKIVAQVVRQRLQTPLCKTTKKKHDQKCWVNFFFLSCRGKARDEADFKFLDELLKSRPPAIPQMSEEVRQRFREYLQKEWMHKDDR